MKFLLVLVGAVCLLGRIQAQTLSTTVNSAISISKTSLAAAIQQLNNTVNTADQSVHTAYTQFTQNMAALYTSYYNRFQNYTTVDLSGLTNAITNIPNNMYPPQPIQDWSTTQIFSDVQTSAQQVENALIAAVNTMSNSCASPCTNPKVATCTTKFGPKLTASPITMDRLTDCVTAELARYSDIGSNMASMYTNVLTNAMNYLKVVDVCDTPSAEVLNSLGSPMSNSPSIQCFTQYLQRVSSMPVNLYTIDSMRYPQTYLVQQRVTRCAKLVELDLKDRISKVLESFQNCL